MLSNNMKQKCVCEINSFGRMINPLCFHHLELIKRTKDPLTIKGLMRIRETRLKELES